MGCVKWGSGGAPWAVACGVPTIEELNRSWEEHLTDFNAQTWARMKAVGAMAGWEVGWAGQPAETFTQGGNASSARNDFFEFVVMFRGNELIREGRSDLSPEALVAETVFRAARMLESLGVQVMPR